MVVLKKEKKPIKVLTDKELAKKYPGSGFASDISVLPEDALWLPSRNIGLNYTLGGGIPYGRILEIFGGESSGKTLTALDFAYVTIVLGGIVLINDAEQSFTADWAIKNGLDLDRIIIYNNTSIEKSSDWIRDSVIYWRSILVNNEPILLITDSIAALECEDNMNASQLDSKAEMGNRARAMGKYLRLRNPLLSELGVCSIFINQLRQKIGSTKWEDPDETPGGKAMRFFASIRLGMYGSKTIEEKDIPVGRLVSIRTKKNKVAPPRGTFKTKMYFDDSCGKLGLDKYYGLPELLVQIGVLKRVKGSSWYKYKDKNIANGEDGMIKLLEKDETLRSILIRKSGINTISKTRKKLEDLKERNINNYKITARIIKASKEEKENKEEGN